MGNCCGDKSTGSNNNTVIVNALCQKIYQLGSSEMPKYDEVMNYCKELKNLSHPNVRPLTSFNHHNDQLVLNYHLHEDTDLARYLESKKNSILPSQIAKNIIRQICSGLQYLHGKEIIHGELNLKNIEINPSTNEIQIMNMNLSQAFKLKITKSTSQMKEFESPESQREETLTYASDLYSLGVIGLTLYGVSFSTTLKVSKPIHCPFGLYEKLKALTNQSFSNRPPLDEVIDALDFETNPSSFNNIESQDKDKKSNAPKEDQISIKSKQKEPEIIHDSNINPQIISQKNIPNGNVPSFQLDNGWQQNSQPESKQNIPNQGETKATSQQKLQPKSEKIYKQEPEKIEYDFNPYKMKPGKDIHYINPMKRSQFYQDHGALITSIVSDKNNNYILTSSLDGSIIVYQYDSSSKQLKEHLRLNEFSYGVSQALITKDNNFLVAADLSSNIYIYNLKDFKLHKKISNLFEKSCILSIDVSDDNKQLLVSATYKNTLLCQLNNFEISQKQNIQGLSSNGNICRFYQNNIIIGEESGKLLVYSKDNLITPQKELRDHNNTITQISIGQQYFAVSSQDKNISIYDKTYNKIQNITAHVDCVANVAISNDDTSLTSNGWDGSTCLYQKNASNQFELKSNFPNETSWSVSSIYIKKNNVIVSSGGRFLFIFV